MKQAVLKSLPVMLVTVLLSALLLTGAWMDKALIVIAAVWGLYLAATWYKINRHRINNWVQNKRTCYKAKVEERKKACRNEKAAAQRGPEAERVPSADQSNVLLLRHVGHRVTDYLTSAFPKATWEWCGEPLVAVLNTGAVGIKLNGVPGFNFAEIVFDSYANIKIRMAKVEDLEQVLGTADPGEDGPCHGNDPKAWYDLQCRESLNEVIADLNSRGFTYLLIKETGAAVVVQDDAELLQTTFQNFPSVPFWPGIVEAIKDSGLKASAGEHGIIVSWAKQER